MSFADKVKSFFHHGGDKVQEVASDADATAVKEKATEVADKVKDTASDK